MIDEKRCILIVDDEVKIVRALKDFFHAKGFHVLEAYDGKEALNRYYEYNTQIDLMILDVMLPIHDGYFVLKELRENDCFVPTIMLTAKGEEYDQLLAFKYGADDYVSKPFSPALLLARVEAILKRTGKDAQSEVAAGDIVLNSLKRTAFMKHHPLELTKREFDLLFFLIVNMTLTFSREQLLNSVWGYEFNGDIRTVDTHIKQLRIKLGDKANYIKTIHRVGYRFEVSNEA